LAEDAPDPEVFGEGEDKDVTRPSKEEAAESAVLFTKLRTVSSNQLSIPGYFLIYFQKLSQWYRRKYKRPEALKADVALVSDTEMFADGLPTLCVGLRGMVYTEIEVQGARTDLHSGMYGGAAPNPFVALAQIIAHLKDAEGKIQIPGIYEGIEAPSADELQAWKALPFDEEHYRETEVGSKELVGEAGYSVLERTWARPSLDVHGMPGGFTGAGAKNWTPSFHTPLR